MQFQLVWHRYAGMEEFVLIIAGFIAGVMNAIAGGGTFVSFPALVWAGVPPLSANATATFAALPGYLSSAWAYRGEFRQARKRILALIAAAAVGGLCGAGLLLVTPAEIFDGLVPWLLVVATIVFVWGPAILRRTGPLPSIFAAACVFAICVYGGYFNGGLGIMLLAGLSLAGMQNIHEMNGLKNLMSAVISVTSVSAYFAAGLIDISSALIVGVAGFIGGIAGATFARQIKRADILRWVIGAIGAVMAILFFLK